MKAINYSLVARNFNQLENEQVPIYIKFTMSGKTVMFPTGESVEPPIYDLPFKDEMGRKIKGRKIIKKSRWELTHQFKNVSKRSAEYQQRERLDAFVDRIDLINAEILKDGNQISIDEIKARVKGETEAHDSEPTLFSVYNEYKIEFTEMVKDRVRCANSFPPYKGCANYLKKFLNYKFTVSDLKLSELKKTFHKDFLNFMYGKLKRNSANKYACALTTLMNFALEKEYIEIYPFLQVKKDWEQITPVSLTPDEFLKVLNKKIDNPYLDYVRDLLVFSCVSGFAYSDMMGLKPEHIKEHTFEKFRQKTKVLARPAITGIAQRILAKYANHPECIAEGKCFPFIINYRANQRLIKVMVLCGITKHITLHKGRHTYCVSAIKSGMSIPALKLSAGHTPLSPITMHYARVNEESTLLEHSAGLLKQYA